MLEQIWRFISFHPEITLIGAITLIQVTPIKLNPWSAIAKAFRKLLMGTIESKLSAIEATVSKLESRMQEEGALQARTHILRFADELYDGKHHSKEYFDDILEDIDKYEKYCEAHKEFKNNKTVMSISLIKSTYRVLIEEHKFN